MNVLRFCVFFYGISLSAQMVRTDIHFLPVFGKHPLEFNQAYSLSTATDSVRIETLKFYVSNIRLLKQEKEVYQSLQFDLIDFEKKSQLSFYIPKKTDFDVLVFDVGIDSLTNVSGVKGMDLDPTQGMYWTWQSGYVNFKLEGTSNLCKTRNHQFQFHIGGYLVPYVAVQEIRLPVTSTSIINVQIDVKEFLNQIDLSTMNQIMSPGEKALQIAKLLPTIYTQVK